MSYIPQKNSTWTINHCITRKAPSDANALFSGKLEKAKWSMSCLGIITGLCSLTFFLQNKEKSDWNIEEHLKSFILSCIKKILLKLKGQHQWSNYGDKSSRKDKVLPPLSKLKILRESWYRCRINWTSNFTRRYKTK